MAKVEINLAAILIIRGRKAMLSSPKAGAFSVAPFVQKEEIKHTEVKVSKLTLLPPQIKSRVAHNPNQKMMSDFAIGKIKAAVIKIVEEQQSIYKNQHPDASETSLDAFNFRRFRKEEIEAALGKMGKEEIKADLVNNKLPYGVYHAKIRDDKKEKEIFAFINKGLKEFAEKIEKDEYFDLIKTNILGIGGMGIVKVLHDMDDPSRCYALKIIPENSTSDASKEYKHAAQAGLALARFVRSSPTHTGKMQEEILMEYVPGTNLDDFFNPHKDIVSKEPPGTNLRPLELLILLQKMATCVQESVHQFGSIHRDIKPSNFIYDPDTGVLKLVDFGIAVTPTPESKGIYNDRSGVGTTGYLALEAIWKDIYTQQTDVFALGTSMALVLDMIDMKCLKSKIELDILFGTFKLSSKPNPEFIKKIPDEEIRSYLETLLSMMKVWEPEPERRPTVKECEEVLDNIVKLQRVIDMNADRGLYKTKIQNLLQGLKEKYSAVAAEKYPVAKGKP